MSQHELPASACHGSLHVAFLQQKKRRNDAWWPHQHEDLADLLANPEAAGSSLALAAGLGEKASVASLTARVNRDSATPTTGKHEKRLTDKQARSYNYQLAQ